MVPLLRQVLHRPALSEALFRFDPWGNPFGEEATADPYALMPVLRKDGPVIYRRLYQQWFITGYEEAKHVMALSHAVTSPQVEMMLDVRPYTKVGRRSRAFLQNILLFVDPPDHARLRGLVNRAFTPRQVARLDERMDAILDELLDNFDPSTADIAREFNTKFPVYVIAELLGVPDERRQWISDVSSVITQLLDPFRGFDVGPMDAAMDDFYDYVLALAADRRENPQDDMMTGLALAEDDGDRLTEDELVAMVGTLLFAGHETTAGIFGNALVALEKFPEQRQWIRDNPDMWPNAVDELIRYDSAIKANPRAASEDIRVGGKVIPAGSNIVILLTAANRDERRFENPDELQLDREDPAPVSFGHGIHYCIGANLAKAELRKGLPRLLELLGDYQIVPGSVEWKQSVTLRGPIALKVRPGTALLT